MNSAEVIIMKSVSGYPWGNLKSIKMGVG